MDDMNVDESSISDAIVLEFCYQYVMCRFNVSAACRAMRMSNGWGQSLLMRTDVQKKIEDIASELIENRKMTAARVLKELYLLSFSRIQDFIEEDKDGMIRVKSPARFGELGAAVKKLRFQNTCVKTGKDGSTNPEDVDYTQDYAIIKQSIDLEVHDKIRPLGMLGNAMGILSSNGDAPPAGDIEPEHEKWDLSKLSADEIRQLRDTVSKARLALPDED